MTEELRVDVSGLAVGALAWGPADGPLALLLHGFPDTAWTWRKVAPRLAAAGWRVVAPFSRGYAPTGLAPDGRYQLGALVRDAVASHAVFGGDSRAMLVGHDWGAMTAYGTGVLKPSLFARIVALAVPPMPTMRRAFRGSGAARLALRQLRCSWYVLANQVPGLCELAFEPLVRRLWADWSPGYDATDDLTRVLAALPTRARRTAALSYYRATAQPWRRAPEYAAEERSWLAAPPGPTLYLHGERDGALLAEVAAGAAGDLAPGSRAVLVPAAGHFLQLEQPARVADEILRFASGD